MSRKSPSEKDGAAVFTTVANELRGLHAEMKTIRTELKMLRFENAEMKKILLLREDMNTTQFEMSKLRINGETSVNKTKPKKWGFLSYEWTVYPDEEIYGYGYGGDDDGGYYLRNDEIEGFKSVRIEVDDSIQMCRSEHNCAWAVVNKDDTWKKQNFGVFGKTFGHRSNEKDWCAELEGCLCFLNE